MRPRATDRPSVAATVPQAAARIRAGGRFPRRVPAHDTPLLVLFGSILGDGGGIRRGGSPDLRDRSTASRRSSVRSTTFVGKLPTEGGVSILCASYNGAPPDNAAGQYVEWLRRRPRADACAGVPYAVFGCGNRDWTCDLSGGAALHRRAHRRAGRNRIAARGEGNAREDLDGQYEAWFAGLRPVAAQAFAVTGGLERETRAEPLYRVETVAPAIDNAAVAATGGLHMRVVENRELLAAPGRSTRHIEFELPEGVAYRAGDHLAVAPRNEAALVAAVAARFGLTPETTIRLDAAAGRRADCRSASPCRWRNCSPTMWSCNRSPRANTSRRSSSTRAAR